jgi:hypothetical protein
VIVFLPQLGFGIRQRMAPFVSQRHHEFMPCLYRVPVNLDQRSSIFVDGRSTIPMTQFGPAQLSVRESILKVVAVHFSVQFGKVGVPDSFTVVGVCSACHDGGKRDDIQRDVEKAAHR